MQFQRGQALIVALGAMFIVLFGADTLTAFGGALALEGRLQRATGLAALSAGRSMRDDFARLFEPTLIDGRPNPHHLGRAASLARARAAALEAGRHNGLDLAPSDVSLPGGGAPTRVKVKVKRKLPVAGGEVRADATATAELSPPVGAPLPPEASGSGYTGPLAYRQGKAFHHPEVAARIGAVMRHSRERTYRARSRSVRCLDPISRTSPAASASQGEPARPKRI